jgi:hypothetical protein
MSTWRVVHAGARAPVPSVYGSGRPAFSPPTVLRGRGKIFPAPARGNPAPHGGRAINLTLINLGCMPAARSAVGNENRVPSVCGVAGLLRAGVCRGSGCGGRGGRCMVVLACRLPSTGRAWTVRGRKLVGCGGFLVGNHRCCCVRVCQCPVTGRSPGGGALSLSGRGLPLQEVARV